MTVLALCGSLLLSGGGFPAAPFAFSPDGRLLACDGPTDLVIVDVGESKVRRHIPKGGSDQALMQISKDGTLAAVGRDGISIWDTTTGKLRSRIKGFTSINFVLAPDGKRLFYCNRWDSSSGQHEIRVADMATGKDSLAADARVEGIDISPDGKLLVGAGTHGDLQFWNLPTMSPVATLKTGAMSLLAVSFSSDGTQLVLGGTAKVGKDLPVSVTEVWSVADRKLVTKLPRFDYRMIIGAAFTKGKSEVTLTSMSAGWMGDGMDPQMNSATYQVAEKSIGQSPSWLYSPDQKTAVQMTPGKDGVILVDVPSGQVRLVKLS